MLPLQKHELLPLFPQIYHFFFFCKYNFYSWDLNIHLPSRLKCQSLRSYTSENLYFRDKEGHVQIAPNFFLDTHKNVDIFTIKQLWTIVKIIAPTLENSLGFDKLTRFFQSSKLLYLYTCMLSMQIFKGS